ncbi:hypothetical protein ACTFIV_008807 [Dictyostelium citrinum]
MKFLAILLILVSILGYSNAKDQYIKTKVYCGAGCVGNDYKEIEINVSECTLFEPEQTCGYALPYLTATPIQNVPKNYSVVTSIGCKSIEISNDVATVGVCNTYTFSDITFSIFPNEPEEGKASSSSFLKPVALLATMIILIVSLIL